MSYLELSNSKDLLSKYSKRPEKNLKANGRGKKMLGYLCLDGNS